jgi:Arc/MetJ-type ribon-helix-helix transcriptional regulator
LSRRDPLRPTTVTLGRDQFDQLRKLAERRLSSVSQVVRELVRAGVERELRQESADGAAPERRPLTPVEQALAAAIAAAIERQIRAERPSARTAAPEAA